MWILVLLLGGIVFISAFQGYGFKLALWFKPALRICGVGLAILMAVSTPVGAVLLCIFLGLIGIGCAIVVFNWIVESWKEDE